MPPNIAKNDYFEEKSIKLLVEKYQYNWIFLLQLIKMYNDFRLSKTS